MSDRGTTRRDHSLPEEGTDSVSSHRRKSKRVLIETLMRDPEIRDRMKIIDDAINDFIESQNGSPEVLYEAARYLLRAGGKRLRSLIVLLSCEAVGGDIKNVLPFAIAVELVQTASLIHDDVIDDDVLRRGVETAHRKFGTRIAVLAGDLLVAQAIRLIGDMASPELLSMVGQGGILMCEGEASDMLMEVDKPRSISTQDYLKMIERKTAALMRVAAGVGALIGGGTLEQREALMDYANSIGMAFQIQDDVLNLTVSSDITGKSMLSDLKWETSNFVLVHCIENAPATIKEQCLRSLRNGDIEGVLRLVEASGSIRFAEDLARKFAEDAKRIIDGHEFQTRDLLKRIADFVVLRSH